MARKRNFDGSNPIPEDHQHLAVIQKARVVTPQDKEEDRELDCAICVSLVSDATLSRCCGSLYCKTCIHTWLEENETCPNCRKDIDEERDLFPDLRTDRKSSQCQRGCKNNEHGCAFMGTRKEVAAHELDCQNVPVEVLRTKLEDSERTKKELEEGVASLAEEIVRIRQREADGHTAHKNEIAAAAWKKPEEILKSANSNLLGVIKFFDFSELDNIYSYAYRRVVTYDFKIEIHIANNNVSLYLFVTSLVRPAGFLEGITFYLFHPTDRAKNRTKHITHIFEANEKGGQVVSNWMTLTEFKEHVHEGRFAVGV